MRDVGRNKRSAVPADGALLLFRPTPFPASLYFGAGGGGMRSIRGMFAATRVLLNFHW
jgi:hypothetical protein